jgi:hypothetical protein
MHQLSAVAADDWNRRKGASGVASEYHLRLPKPAKGATLAEKSPGIGRMSVRDAYFWNARADL